MATAPEPPKPVRRLGYAYGLDGFTVQKIRRVEPNRLKELLFPQSLKGKRLQKAAQEDAGKIVKKPWVMAQLKHYGIEINRQATLDEARTLLSKSVTGRRCDSVPKSVRNIEATLRAAFEPLESDHKSKQVGHQQREAARIAKEFRQLKSPTEEAGYSIPLFLEKYFLTEDGRPDRSKRLDPLPLPGFRDRAKMHAAAEPVPGLVTCSGGQGNDRVLVIGWFSSEVERVASEIAKGERVHRAAEQDSEWQQRMKQHTDFVKAFRPRKPKHRFSIEDAVGTYIIKCDQVQDQWPDQSQDMELSITNGPDGWVGIFNFGVLEGIMLLAESEAELTARVAEAGEEDSYSDNYDEDDDDDDIEDDDHSGDRFASQKGQKRKTPSSNAKQPQFSKRQKKTKSVGGRLYLQWRGQDTSEGVIQLDEENRHIGRLDFAENGTRFSGVMPMSSVGEEVQFQGYKIDGIGGEVTDHWSNYSSAAYESARVGRWG